MKLYNAYTFKDKFSTKYFEKLAVNVNLNEHIITGKTEKEIRDSRERGLSQYKSMRKKYLI